MNGSIGILLDNPELAGRVRLEVTAADLLCFANEILRSRAAERSNREQWLTMDETAALVKRSKITLSGWHRNGTLKHNQLDLYNRQDVLDFLRKE